MDAQAVEDSEVLEIMVRFSKCLAEYVRDFCKKAYLMNQKVKVLGCARSVKRSCVICLKEKYRTERSVEIWCVKRWQNI